MGTLFVTVLTYVKPLEEIDEQLVAHNRWLKKGYNDGAFLASGRRIPRTGGVIIAKADNAEALEARMREDPLQRMG